jgi:hypothetical protein
VRNTNFFQRSLVICAVLLCGIVAGHADHSHDTYFDLVRPNGHPRSDAIFEADLNFCYRQTGPNRMQQDTPAFKKCMLGRQWRWESVQTVRDPSRSKRRPDCFDLSFDCK